MTYDASDGYVLLFGGLDGRGGGAVAENDTWTFSNGTWTLEHPGRSPPAESAASMTYDPADGYVVLFGGWTAAGTGHPVGSTWVYRAGNWTQLAPTVAPPGRASPGMTYDGHDGYVLMFGGYSGSRYFNDTWAFSNGNWTNLTGTHAPAPRDQLYLTYDGADGYALLFGGENAGTQYGDTWTFASGSWTELFNNGYPGTWSTGTMAYDPAVGYVLLFGGYSFGTYFGQTFEWRAGAWSPLSSASSPNGRAAATMAYDGTDGSVVLMGGNPSNPSVQENDTWTWMSPWVRVSMTPPETDLGEAVTLTAAAESPAGGFMFNWTNASASLGCPSSTNGTVDCIATQSGNFTIRLNVTDLAGAWSQGEVSVSVAADPIAATPIASVSTADVGQSVTFTTTGTLGTPPYVSYAWDGLAPGCTGVTTASVTCQFPSSGTWPISANVTDATGTISNPSGILDFTVFADPTVPTLTASRLAVDVGQNVTFFASVFFGSGSLRFVWQGLTSGCSVADNESSCSFNAPSALSVSVSVVDSNGFASASSSPVNVTVYADPVVRVAPSQTVIDVSGTFNLSASVTLGSGGFRYDWSGLPSQCPASGANVTCAVRATGVLLVRVMVTDSNGAQGNSSLVAIQVNSALTAPTPTVSSSPVAAQAVTFHEDASGGTPPLVDRWTFGDGGTGTGPSVLHTYRTAGSYTVKVTVNDSTGAQETESVIVRVDVSPQSEPASTVLGLPPWIAYATLAGVALAAAVGALWAVRNRRRPSRSVATRSRSTESFGRPPTTRSAGPGRPPSRGGSGGPGQRRVRPRPPDGPLG